MILFSAFDSSVREHLVFCDSECMLYHFAVYNNSLVDGIKIPPEVIGCEKFYN